MRRGGRSQRGGPFQDRNLNTQQRSRPSTEYGSGRGSGARPRGNSGQRGARSGDYGQNQRAEHSGSIAWPLKPSKTFLTGYPGGQQSGQSTDYQELPTIALDQLSQEFAKLEVTPSHKYAIKPEPGSKGEPATYVSNLIPIALECDLTVCHYDVTIAKKQPRRDDSKVLENCNVLPKTVNNRVFSHYVAENSEEGGLFHKVLPVFDGRKNMYTAKPLGVDENGLLAHVNESTEKQDFLLKITKTNPCEISIPSNTNMLEQEAVQILDIIVRYGPARTKISNGQNIFYPSGEGRGPRRTLPRNMEFDFGFYQSVRCCESGLVLNVQRVGGTFYRAGHMLTVICRLLNWRKESVSRSSSIPEDKFDFIRKELKGVQFRTYHLRRRQTAVGLTKETPSEIYFDTDGGAKMSVRDHFKERYGFELKYRNMPCLITQMGDKSDKSMIKKHGYFPLEMCELAEDQFVRKKLPKEVAADFTRLSEQKPHKFFHEVLNAGRTIMEEGQQFLKEFKIKFDEVKLLTVPGRIIESPKLHYESSDFTPNDTATWNLVKKRLFRTVPLYDWALVKFGSIDDRIASTFINELREAGNKLGILIDDPKPVMELEFASFDNLEFSSVDNLKRDLFQEAAKKKYQILVCLFSGDDETYKGIKKTGDHECGIVTQCINFEKHGENIFNGSYLANVLLKMNAKLGGVNVITKDIPPDTMVVGIDVTHPSPGSNLKHSIAACVATYDRELTMFDVETAVQAWEIDAEDQKSKKRVYEMVEVGPAIAKLLEQYKSYNGNTLPKRMIVYRDGVSEGQFDQVMTKEKDALVGLLSGLENPPKLIYVVVQKRHNVRIGLIKQGSVENPPPGTVVDVGITDPVLYDFFLCSHNAMKGTSRPIRCRVLYDELGFKMDQIQKLTHNMCFTYSSCTKAISIPTPVKYADEAAYRARLLIDDASTVTSDDECDLPEEVLKKLNDSVQKHSELRGKLFIA